MSRRAGADVNWKHVLYKTPNEELLRAVAEDHWKTGYATVVIIGTPLHEACSNGKSPEVVEALLAAGADVNATIADNATVYDSHANENTPLMSLARWSRAPITS